MDLPQWRMDRFQSLAVSRPEMNWNSFGVSQESWNQMQGPLLPWQSLKKVSFESFARYIVQYCCNFTSVLKISLL